ncbi:hypothetical protein GCM10022419_056450 [Nonomuraea rosea]|uniref:Uncharacterized protein n=1 Tax=Nonomuraea rosea TaxID=638574 RepID=A0ABP6XK11_9ACTN
MHPDKWSVAPFYDGFALMGTPRTKTFARPWAHRGTSGPFYPRRPGYQPVMITLSDRLYVIVIGWRKNLAKIRDCSSTKLESIGQHTVVSPETGATVQGIGLQVPCQAPVK